MKWLKLAMPLKVAMASRRPPSKEMMNNNEARGSILGCESSRVFLVVGSFSVWFLMTEGFERISRYLCFSTPSQGTKVLEIRFKMKFSVQPYLVLSCLLWDASQHPFNILPSYPWPFQMWHTLSSHSATVLLECPLLRVECELTGAPRCCRVTCGLLWAEFWMLVPSFHHLRIWKIVFPIQDDPLTNAGPSLAPLVISDGLA